MSGSCGDMIYICGESLLLYIVGKNDKGKDIKYYRPYPRRHSR